MGKGPVFEEHVRALYAELANSAIKVGKPPVLTFTGSLTSVFDDVIGNRHYYTKVRSVLVNTGSIEITQQGNRSRPSVVVLHHAPPSRDEWPEHLTGTLPSATMQAEVVRRVEALEGWRESTREVNIVEALRNMERRLAALESRLAKLSKGRK